MIRSAGVSADGRYRYWLERRWAEGDALTFVMLNPSTADADVDDPTIKRCIKFADGFGYGALRVMNLFAFRATDPRALVPAYRSGVDIVGPLNGNMLRHAYDHEPVLVAAWGAHVVARIPEAVKPSSALCLGVNASDGSPKHPLYVPGWATLKPWPA